MRTHVSEIASINRKGGNPTGGDPTEGDPTGGGILQGGEKKDKTSTV